MITSLRAHDAEGGTTVNKAELVEALAQHYEGSKTEATRALDAVVQTITRSTVAGERVAITGFGVFERVERPARLVRNPRTGERKEAPATAVPRFRAGAELKAYVAGQRELPDLAVAAPGAAPRTSTRTRRPAAAPRPAVVQEAPVESDPSAGMPAEAVTSKKADGRKAASKKVATPKADSKADSKAGSKKAASANAASAKAASKKSAGKMADGAKAGAKKSNKKSSKKSAKK